MIGSDPSAVVTATLPYIGATSVSLTAKTHGPNYSLSTNSWTTDTTGTFEHSVVLRIVIEHDKRRSI